MKQQHVFFILLIFGFIGFSFNLKAQTTELTIIDEHTLEPCAYSNIVLYDANNNFLKGAVSDINGKAELDIDVKTKIVISSVGYVNYTDTISPGENKTIRLKFEFVNLDEVVVTGQYEAQTVDQSIYRIDVVNS